jgi:hypothetical protein
MRTEYKISLETMKGREQLRNLDIFGKIILRCILIKQYARIFDELNWLQASVLNFLSLRLL